MQGTILTFLLCLTISCIITEQWHLTCHANEDLFTPISPTDINLHYNLGQLQLYTHICSGLGVEPEGKKEEC